MSDPMSNTLASPGLNKSLGAYAVFMALNIVGVQIAATFELVVTLLAIFELLVFMGVVAPGFSIANFAHNGWAGADAFSLGSIGGMVAAIPFAILFFPAIEGVAMGAEEARDPKRSIPIAYIGGILTLVVLAAGVMVFAGGAGDWTRLANINDPLPQAMKMIVGEASGWLHMLVWLGVIGILAIFSDQLVSFGGQPSPPTSSRWRCSGLSSCTSSAWRACSGCAEPRWHWRGRIGRRCIRCCLLLRWSPRPSAWSR